MQEIETDYLVVGAGAAGMAFTDEILAHSDATVTIVDRRHAPGGHWVDAYPYVRLHQPSAFYGVSSARLGEDALDESGPNQGFYELAGADEICAYYDRLMTRHFLSSGRVEYFPNCDYLGESRFASRLGPASWQVRVKEKIVDATYLEGEIPATSPPPFELHEGVRWATAGELARIQHRPERYVIVGGGKTALDSIVWLLGAGVPPGAITWIKSREGWWMNRKFQQPYALSPDYFRGLALQFQAMAEAKSADEVLERLEEQGVFLRVDAKVPPTMLRGAIISEAELSLLRQVEDVVRMGHVRRISRTEITLDDGTIPTTEETLHVHCAASALGDRGLRPIFEPGRVTIQALGWGYICYQYALLGVVEATVDGDDEKNRLCPPIRYWNHNPDYLRAFLANLVGGPARRSHPALGPWIKSTRLNPANAVAGYREDPTAVEARASFKRHGPLALENLPKLIAAAET